MTLKNLRIVAAFIFFGFVPIIAIGVLGSVWSQSQALAVIPVVATPDTYVISRLAKTQDPTEYKRLAVSSIEFQNEIASGVSDIATIVNSSLRKSFFQLLLLISALYVVALGAAVMFFRKTSE